MSSNVWTVEATALLQGFYLIASLVIFFVYSIPALSSRFLAYGARDTNDNTSGKPRQDASSRSLEQHTRISDTLDYLSSLKVPHSWFTHFYLVSTASSVFWAHQLLTGGPFFLAVSAYTLESTSSMTVAQVAVCWLLLALQGTRRLYESLTLGTASESQMWFGHYLIGMAFYMATGIAIWVEGIHALRSSQNVLAHLRDSISIPSLDETVPIALFFAASIFQYSVHVHLASLKKYTLPTHPAFKHIAAPHYTAECAIYFALAFLSAPHWLNGTMTAALVFVIINLGVSADGTKKWMEGKFGKGAIRDKWRMLPGIW